MTRTDRIGYGVTRLFLVTISAILFTNAPLAGSFWWSFFMNFSAIGVLSFGVFKMVGVED
jgi:hypothetical protein